MKSDFAKIVTERPRAGGGYKNPKGWNARSQHRTANQCEQENWPKREKIRQKWQSSFGEKQFTDVLGPLYGYLLKQVGRHWDDVFSEICENLPANNTNTSHVRDHVFDFVEVDVVMVDGVPCYRRSFGKYTWLKKQEWTPLSVYGSRQFQLYVNPENGLLCKLEKKKEVKKDKKEGKGVIVDDTHQYHKIDGVWYLLALKIVNRHPEYYELFYDVGYKKNFRDSEMFRHYGKRCYCIHKTQLNKRQIKKAKLNGE